MGLVSKLLPRLGVIRWNSLQYNLPLCTAIRNSLCRRALASPSFFLLRLVLNLMLLLEEEQKRSNQKRSHWKMERTLTRQSDLPVVTISYKVQHLVFFCCLLLQKHSFNSPSPVMCVLLLLPSTSFYAKLGGWLDEDVDGDDVAHL